MLIGRSACGSRGVRPQREVCRLLSSSSSRHSLSALPPLPKAPQLERLIPRRLLRITNNESSPGFPHRLSLQNPTLTDKFVEAIKWRDNEVLIECFSGPGFLTRSLITGGQQEVSSDPSDRPIDEETPIVGRAPTLVVVSEPSHELLCIGFGMSPESSPAFIAEESKPTDSTAASISTVPRNLRKRRDNVKKRFGTFKDLFRGDGVAPPVITVQSPLDGLLLSPSNPFSWGTLPGILSNPIVSERMTPCDPTISGIDAYKRSWTDEPPHITIAGTFPDARLGEQLFSQWVSSATKSSTDSKTYFIWAWGRVRMAFLLGLGLYDVSRGFHQVSTNSQRVMARPGELIHCKLTVMVNALFHLRPLPPYHHITNIDKQSSLNAPAAISATQKLFSGRSLLSPDERAALDTTFEPQELHHHEPTVTYARDYYPPIKGFDPESQLPRPRLLGVEMTPRLDSPITTETRDSWEYVLRHCFMTEATRWEARVETLGFGGDKLIPKMMQETDVEGQPPYKGRPLKPGVPVRDLEMWDWMRIVDVFHRWPFKPEVSRAGPGRGTILMSRLFS